MSFSCFTFLFTFLPCMLLLYFLVPAGFRNFLLIIGSFFFYAWGDPSGLPCLIGISAAGYLSVLVMTRKEKYRKPALIAGLVLILGWLCVCKYTAFLFENLNALGLGLSIPEIKSPAGISFFAFTAAGFVIDAYTGRFPLPDVESYLTFITMFPKLLMGPIVGYEDLSAQIRRREITGEKLEKGAFLFAEGLFKKAVIADNIVGLWDEVQSIGFESCSSALSWLGVIAFSLELYFDFSGYSDMASGLASMFGFELPENFHTPYSSVSVTEFWRRWHITMGAWFRNYVYFPLGGSRCSAARRTLNILAVWILTGLWHGSAWNFVLWGLYHFAILSLEKRYYLKWLEKHRFAGHIYTLFAEAVGWSIFAVSDLPELSALLISMFSFSSGVSSLYYLRNYGVLLLLSVIFSTEQAEDLLRKLSGKTALRLILTLVMIVISIAYITDSTYTPFLYAQF